MIQTDDDDDDDDDERQLDALTHAPLSTQGTESIKFTTSYTLRSVFTFPLRRCTRRASGTGRASIKGQF